MTQKNRSDFAQLLTHFRERRGISNGQLAQAVRLSRTYMYHLETGQRINPSPLVARHIAQVLELKGVDKQRFYRAYTVLTHQCIEDEPFDATSNGIGDLAKLLVQNSLYPAHTLDRLWFLHAWNEAATTLLELPEEANQGEPVHVLSLLFDSQHRKRFYDWEPLARRLVNDFLYSTHTFTYLPEYKRLWKKLLGLPEFLRIAESTYPCNGPTPSLRFRMRHSKLGLLTLRTATMVFTGASSYSMVSYIPDNQRPKASRG
ncbi:MAG TPA: helix-turn-helix domain-containing protein [Ktedonosporobacter sp.]|nr:helix-turn-helix domain-containing protein [Ktedonosporobacter sp.]